MSQSLPPSKTSGIRESDKPQPPDGGLMGLLKGVVGNERLDAAQPTVAPDAAPSAANVMASIDHYSPLFEQAFDRFEVAWKTTPVPVLSEYLPCGLSEDEQCRVLLELVLIDLEYRWKQFGSDESMPVSESSPDSTLISQLPRCPLLEDYCQMFPELGSTQGLPLAVIAHEFRQRRNAGRSPILQEYLARFPHLADELARELSGSDQVQASPTKSVPMSPSQPDSPLDPFEMTQIEAPHPSTQDNSQPANLSIKPSATPTLKTTFQSQLAISLRSCDLIFSNIRQGAACDYEVGQILGEGGMGSVFRARQACMDRDVAVKMVKRRFLAGSSGHETISRFLVEAMITGGLEHPNIVPIYDAGLTAHGEPFYAMKEVRGTAWSETIDSVSEDDNLTTLLRVADAIRFAHARGVVHRDLKPANIMLGEFGEVLVLDWGLALPTSQYKNSQIPVTQGLAGTPAYMAPEMAADDAAQIGPLSDVYLLGAVLFRCLTGKAPHHGRTASECLRSAGSNEIVPTERHDELMQIAQKAMATKPAERYPSVAEFQQALREYRSHAESHRLVEFAQREVATANSTGDYRRFEKGVFGLEQALVAWSENSAAQQSLVAARRDYARAAFDRHDYELAEQQLDPQQPSHAELLPQIHWAKLERDARVVRLRRMKRVAAGLAVTVLLTVSVAALIINRSRHLEQLAKNEAVKRFQQSQTAIERLTSISDQIRSLPRMQTVRKNLLGLIQDYYQELTEAPSPNPVMQLELARSLVRLGDVHSVLSEHREALQAWDKATRYAEPLRSTNLASDVRAIARQVQVRSATSDRALHEFASARWRLETTLVELRQAGPGARLELASALFQLGLLWREMGRATSAIDTLREAEEIYQQLAETDTQTTAQRGWATTLSTLGQLRQRTGEFDLAADNIRQALAIWSTLYELEASNPELLEGVATSQTDLANALRGAGHEPAAIYEDAIAAYSELVRAQPEVPHYEFNLATVRVNMASLLNRRAESELAQAVAVEGINGFIRLANQYPEDARYQDREAEARITLAEVLRDRHELDLANETLAEATIHLNQRIAEHDLPQYREQQALIASLSGQLHALANESQKAREQFEVAIVLWEQLLQQDSALASRYRDSAAWTRFHFAAVLQESAEPATAKAQVDAAINMRTQLPANAVWDESFAWLLLHSGEPSQPETTRAVMLAQRAANAASDNPRMWRTLALAQLRSQQLDECRQSLNRSRELHQDSSGEQLFLEALLASAAGDHDSARKHYQQADEQMQQTVPGSSRLRTLRRAAELEIP